MKKLLIACASLLAAVGAFAQGSAVGFANTSTTLLQTNNTATGGVGTMPANGQFRIGLYVGTQGTPAGSLTLVGLATNSIALAGRFSGGNPYFLPAPYNTDQTIAFQVRAWSLSGGATYEAAVAALLAGNMNIFVGASTLGQITTATPPAPTPGLFGAGAGQIGGFQVIGGVPEPSSIALGLLGLGAIALFRRRK